MTALILARGLPGSGKTAEFDRRIAEARAAGGRACRISRDDIRAQLFGAPGWGVDEYAVTAIQESMIRVALLREIDVYVDDTNMRAEHLGRLVFWGELEGAGVEVVDRFLSVPVETCIARDAARERPVGEAVIRGMWDRYLAEQAGAVR